MLFDAPNAWLETVLLSLRDRGGEYVAPSNGEALQFNSESLTDR